MAGVGKSDRSSSTSSNQRVSSNRGTQRTQSSQAAKSTTKNKQTRQQPGDRATVSKETGKAGAVPDFSQSFGTTSKPNANANPTLRRNSQGDDVKDLQKMLNSKGAKLDVDGSFGPKTEEALKKFQAGQNIKSDGIAGKETYGKLRAQEAAQPGAEKANPGAEKTQPGAEKANPGAEKPAGTEKPGENAGPAKPGQALDLPPGYESLEKLSGELAKRDPRFKTDTPEGRSATALALAIGGTEMFGKGKTGTNFFTARGGTGNNMLGFAQFNQKYHAGKTNTPEKYTKFMGDILSGQARMPNSAAASNHVKALTEAVSAGKIKNGQDLRNFMTQRGFGGSNWQGIDDGWGRNPGLANALVNYLRQGAN